MKATQAQLRRIALCFVDSVVDDLMVEAQTRVLPIARKKRKSNKSTARKSRMRVIK